MTNQESRKLNQPYMNNLLYLAVLIIDILVILDIFKKSWDMGKKLIWTVVVLVFPVLGAIAYWFIGRK